MHKLALELCFAKHEEAGCCFEAACERQGAVSGWSCERQEAASGSSFGQEAAIDAQRLGACITRDCKWSYLSGLDFAEGKVVLLLEASEGCHPNEVRRCAVGERAHVHV